MTPHLVPGALHLIREARGDRVVPEAKALLAAAELAGAGMSSDLAARIGRELEAAMAAEWARSLAVGAGPAYNDARGALPAKQIQPASGGMRIA
jgi:hypothetical protein